jgi:hypothetical protein
MDPNASILAPIPEVDDEPQISDEEFWYKEEPEKEEDLSPRPVLREKRRIVPSHLTTQWDFIRYERVVAIREKSGYQLKRDWACKMKKKFKMNTESDLQKSKYPSK